MANTTSQGKSAQRKRLYENISCITVDAECAEYELTGLTYFDVPLETYTQGSLTGTRLVAEFIKEARQDDSFDVLQSVLEEASKSLIGDEGGPEVLSKYGAAVGLFSTLQEVFNLAATRVDFTEVFKYSFDFHEAELTEQLEDMRKANAASLASLATNTTQFLEGASVGGPDACKSP